MRQFGFLGQTVRWACTLAYLAVGASTATAQGLIWELPADGAWVRFEGTYAQTEVRADSATGRLEIKPWVEHLWVKSVGQEQAEYNGETVACRWIEIKVERGREQDGKIDTGLAGLEIYKFLVPESKILPASRDADDVPVNLLPIVKGFRKVAAGQPKPLPPGALQLYPLVVLNGYFREVDENAGAEDVATGFGAVSAKVWKAKSETERGNARTDLESTLHRSSEVPFGVAGWTAKITRKVKNELEERSKFQTVTEVVVEMRAAAKGEDAQSELGDGAGVDAAFK